MRPNKVGWVLVAFFAIGGIFFWLTIPEIFIGQIWVGVAALLAILYVVMTVRANKANKLALTGVPHRSENRPRIRGPAPS